MAIVKIRIDKDFFKLTTPNVGWVPVPKRYGKDTANLLYAYNYFEPAVVTYIDNRGKNSLDGLSAERPARGGAYMGGWLTIDAIPSLVNTPKDMGDVDKMIRDVELLLKFIRSDPVLVSSTTTERGDGGGGEYGGGSSTIVTSARIRPSHLLDELGNRIDERLNELKLIKKLIGKGIYNWATYTGVLDDLSPKYSPNYFPIAIDDYPVLTGKLVTHESFINLYRELIENPYNAMPKWSKGFVFLTHPDSPIRLSHRDRALSFSPNEEIAHRTSPIITALESTSSDREFGIMQVTNDFDFSKFNKIPNPDEPRSDEYIRDDRISIKLAIKSIEKSLLQLSKIRKINYTCKYYSSGYVGFANYDATYVSSGNGVANVVLKDSVLSPSIDLSKFYSLQGDIVGHEGAIRLIRDLKRELDATTSMFYRLPHGSNWYDEGNNSFLFYRSIARMLYTNWVFSKGKVWPMTDTKENRNFLKAWD